AAILRLAELGAVVAAVSTKDGAVLDDSGIDIERLVALRREFGDRCVLEYGASAAPEAALRAPVDILIPAAREDVIDEEIAESTTARLVVEGANLPTSVAARDVLHRRGICVVPDFIANAGGIVAAAHSMDARSSAFTVDPARVFPMVSEKLRANAAAVIEASLAAGAPPHQTALRLAQDRVREAMIARGRWRSADAIVTV
ncbi:MAG: Glu/Leu/Phe/Val dehydrogenase, partial [Microbacterium sp.]